MDNKSGSVIIGLFVVIAITLLFIPELTSLTRGSNPANEGSSDSAEEQSKLDSLPVEQSGDVPDNNSLRKLMGRVEEGDISIEHLDPGATPPNKRKGSSAQPQGSGKDLKPAAKPSEDGMNLGQLDIQEEDNLLSNLSDPPIPPERRKEREEMKQLLLQEGGGWVVLKDLKVANPINSAIRETETLLKVVGHNYPRSRFALLSYVTALKSFMAGPPTSPTADFREMLQYIGVLDVRVTQSLIEERIDRTEYLIWRAISLGPFVEVAGADNQFVYDAPFRANITLTDLKLRVTVDKVKRKREYEVAVVGVVEGKDTKRIEVYHGKRLVKLIELPALNLKPDVPPLRRFDFSYREDQGTKPYTFRVLDGRDNFLQKSYSLVALPMKKFKNLGNGTFEIPGVPLGQLTERPVTYLDEALLLSLKSSMTGRKKTTQSGDKVLEFSSFDSRIERLREF